MEQTNTEQGVIDHLAKRLIPPESAEETLDRVEQYLTTPYLQSRTSIPMALAAIRLWKERSA